MIRETYESPKMTFEEVKVDEAVADTCWGYHGKGNTLYADINGTQPGYMSFQIASGQGGCSLDLITVKYYENKDDKTGSDASADQIAKLRTYLTSIANGKEANNFSGFENFVSIDDPKPGFS